jgi:FkbM family methyltransferase
VIVIDIGCLRQGDEESVYTLVDRFRPHLLLGFDIHPDLEAGMEWVDDTLVWRQRAAAWIEDGTIPIRVMGACTSVAVNTRPYEKLERVTCFDLCSLIAALSGPIVLKFDAEGVEYPILHKIVEQGLDDHLELVIVEWHDGVYAHDLSRSRPVLSCPVEEWERPKRGTPSGPTSGVVRSFA